MFTPIRRPKQRHVLVGCLDHPDTSAFDSREHPQLVVGEGVLVGALDLDPSGLPLVVPTIKIRHTLLVFVPVHVQHRPAPRFQVVLDLCLEG